MFDSAPDHPANRLLAAGGTTETFPIPDGSGHPAQIGMDEVPFAPWDVHVDGTEISTSRADESPLWFIDAPWSESEIPLRPWVVKGFLLRGSVTVVSGPGSAGKSSLMVAWAVSLAIGKAFGRFQPGAPMKVLSYNVEDDANEQKRRLSATCRQFEALPCELMDNLRMAGPTELGTLLRIGPDGRLLINTPIMRVLEEYIDRWRPDVLMLDPFVELHASDENDNTAIRQVLARFRAWAVQMNLSLVLLHHSRKGIASPGDPDSLRGASAIVGAARIALTVNTMTEAEASDMGIPPEHRRDYFRLDGAKMNYSRVVDADWFERVEYEMENSEMVAAAVPWNAPKQVVGLSHANQIILAIERGTASGPYSAKISKDPRSIRVAMEAIGVSLQSAQKELLTLIMSQPDVRVETFKGAVDYVKKQGLRTSNGPAANWVE